MKTQCISIIVAPALAWALLSAGSAAARGDEPAGPPLIVATSPAKGATNVNSATTTEITVTFDRDMGEGMSWAGSGSAYPSTPEGKKAYWRDKRTCVLPVKLFDAHYYRVGINSPSYQNFRGADNTPVTPTAIVFTTRGASAATMLRLQTPEVVGMNPANGARGVDPKLAELRVTFNVPMSGGFSWTGGAPLMPESPAGKGAFWTDDHKTCVLPVALQPGAHYQLGLNSRSFHNFRSAAGNALEPVVYTFDTASK